MKPCTSEHSRETMLLLGTDERQSGVRIYWCRECGMVLGDHAHREPDILIPKRMQPKQPTQPERKPASIHPRLLGLLTAELARARAKYPNNRHMTTAMAEEAGEVVKACLDNWNLGNSGKPYCPGKRGPLHDRIETEIVHALCTLVRLYEEGDSTLEVPSMIPVVRDEEGES